MYPIPDAVKPIILYDEVWQINSLIRAQPPTTDCRGLHMLLLTAASIRKNLITFFISTKSLEKMEAQSRVRFHLKSIQIMEAPLTTKILSQNAAMRYVASADLSDPLAYCKDFYAEFTSSGRDNPHTLRQQAKNADRLMRKWLLKRDILLTHLNSINQEIHCLFGAANIIGIPSNDRIKLYKTEDLIGIDILKTQNNEFGVNLPGIAVPASAIPAFQSLMQNHHDSQVVGTGQIQKSPVNIGMVQPVPQPASVTIRPVEDMKQHDNSNAESHPFNVTIKKVSPKAYWWERYQNREYQPKIQLPRVPIDSLLFRALTSKQSAKSLSSSSLKLPEKTLADTTDELDLDRENLSPYPNLIIDTDEEEVQVVGREPEKECLPISVKSECNY